MAEPQQPAAGEQSPAFSIEKIYVKDLSLENPGSPQSFRTQEAPQDRSRPAHAAASRSTPTSTNAC